MFSHWSNLIKCRDSLFGHADQKQCFHPSSNSFKVNLKGSNTSFQDWQRRWMCRVWGKFKSIATTNEMESLCIAIHFLPRRHRSPDPIFISSCCRRSLSPQWWMMISWMPARTKTISEGGSSREPGQRVLEGVCLLFRRRGATSDDGRMDGWLTDWGHNDDALESAERQRGNGGTQEAVYNTYTRPNTEYSN